MATPHTNNLVLPQRPLLLTNDDGYDATGLTVLQQAIAPIANSAVYVFAPRQCHSTRSHAITTNPRTPIHLERNQQNDAYYFVVDGYPADCVRIGIDLIQKEQGCLPLVLAGVNAGANLGIDVYYSATLAATREAYALGCTAVAFSQLLRTSVDTDWQQTGRWVREVLLDLKDHLGSPQKSFWNVNFPISDKAQIRYVAISTDPLAVRYEPHRTEHSALSYSGPYYERPVTPNTDVAVAFGGDIAITPLQTDLTDHACLKICQAKTARD